MVGPVITRGGHPGTAAHGLDEDVEHALLVPGCGGQVGADRGEVLRSAECPQASGDLDPQLGHSDRLLGRVVGEVCRMHGVRVVKRFSFG